MKSELFHKINFHDSKIKEYKKDGTNIAILIEDGWIPNTYFKIKLTNVKVEVMNNKPDLIRLTLDRFYNIFTNDAEHNIAGGQLGFHNDNNQYYLKLYIDWPYNFKSQEQNTVDKYYFDGFGVDLCNDYNDTGNLYIKFIMDDFYIEEI